MQSLAHSAKGEQLRTLSACKNSANRAKYQRKTCFSLYFRDAAYLRPKVKDTTFLRDDCWIPSVFYYPSCLWLRIHTHTFSVYNIFGDEAYKSAPSPNDIKGMNVYCSPLPLVCIIPKVAAAVAVVVWAVAIRLNVMCDCESIFLDYFSLMGALHWVG